MFEFCTPPHNMILNFEFNKHTHVGKTFVLVLPNYNLCISKNQVLCKN